MKRYSLILLSMFLTLLSSAQTGLSLTDVMVFKSDGGLVSNENWQQQEAQTMGIYKRSETRYYTAWGERQSLTLDYWTWRGEKYKSQPGIFADTNEGMSIEMQYTGKTLTIALVNNSKNYLFVKLDGLLPSYCRNEDEGVTYQMLPSTGDNLRNKLWSKYDYALVPPSKKAVAEFYSLKEQVIFPASLPKNAIIQLPLYGAFSETDPWNSISRNIEGKELIKDDVRYFTMSSIDYSNIVSSFTSSFIGFEARYHLKVK